MAVPGRTTACTPMHCHAPVARLVVRPGTTVRLGLPAVLGLCLICTAVQFCRTTVSSTVFLYIAFLDAWSFFKPLIFLEIILEVFLSVETQGFLLKRWQNAF